MSRPRSRKSSTAARRLLGLAGRVGLKVTELGPGAAVLSRSATFDVEEVSTGSAYVISKRGKRGVRNVHLATGVTVANGTGEKIRSTKVGRGQWLLSTGAVAKQGTPTVEAIGKDGWLINRPNDAVEAEPLFETHTMKALGDRHVAWILKRYQVDCVIDVGANIGQFAQSLRDSGFAGHIASVEPVPAFADQAEQAAADDDRWSVHRYALGTSDATVPMRVQRTFSSLLDANDYGRERFGTLDQFADTEQIEVPLRRLDTIWDELLQPVRASGIEHPRVYLKLDTQGFDLEAFKGLGSHAADVVAMQSELALLSIYAGMPRLIEALGVYEAAGFAVTGCYPVSREPDGRVIEYDCTLVRAESLPDRRNEDGTLRKVLF